MAAKKRRPKPKPIADQKPRQLPKRRVIVHFYRVIIDGNSSIPLKAIDLDGIHAQVDAREWRDDHNSRYYRNADQTETIMAWTALQQTPKQIRCIFARELTNSDPAVEEGGKFNFIAIDEKTQKYIAPSYGVFFEDNVFGYIGSVQGPTTAQIATYIHAMTSCHFSIDFEIIAQKNIFERVTRLKYLNKIDVTVTPGSLFYPQSADHGAIDSGDFTIMLEAAARSRSKSVRIVMETAKDTAIKGALDAIKSMMQHGRLDSAHVSKIEVFGPDEFNPAGRTTSVNLLGAYVSIPKFVPRNKRALEPEAAHRAIVEAYQENLASLRENPSVSFKEHMDDAT